MSTLADQWLEVFRAGDYGAKGKFTEQDLRAIASSYDPSLHEAPVVIGHSGDERAGVWLGGKTESRWRHAAGEVAPGAAGA